MYSTYSHHGFSGKADQKRGFKGLPSPLSKMKASDKDVKEIVLYGFSRKADQKLCSAFWKAVNELGEIYWFLCPSNKLYELLPKYAIRTSVIFDIF
jgi:hypothetical protein